MASNGTSSGTGKGGKSFQDRKLAAEVRTLALNEIKTILEDKKDKELYKAILIKLASSILPRLNEHSGADGEPLQVVVPRVVADTFRINGTNSKTNTSDTK